jgi:hypothetical protein
LLIVGSIDEPRSNLEHRNVDAVAVAFLSALIVGSALHYRKIVQNEWYGYPDEWFPSVSATIGDRYPERSIFMIFIAITSGMLCAYPCPPRHHC